jgi:hypothetical protein
MSFLDSLENNLKALENLEQRDPEKVKRELERREAEKAAVLAAAPNVEALRSAPFTEELLKQCRTIGHGQRVLVQFAWIDNTLRLDATSKDKRLELIPSGDGIVAVASVGGEEKARTNVDLAKDNAETLARTWLAA